MTFGLLNVYISKKIGVPMFTQKTVIRFFKKVQKQDDGCWIFNKGGTRPYGEFSVDRVRYMAHRFSFLYHVGPIPDGLFVCHKCDVRKCVNPDHLFLGTHDDNMLDMVRKNRARHANITHCKYGHELTEENVYRSAGNSLKKWRWCRECRLREDQKRARNIPGTPEYEAKCKYQRDLYLKNREKRLEYAKKKHDEKKRLHQEVTY